VPLTTLVVTTLVVTTLVVIAAGGWTGRVPVAPRWSAFRIDARKR
jgi:hypothetical protein